MGYIFGFTGKFKEVWETKKSYDKVYEDLNFRGEIHDTFRKQDYISMITGNKPSESSISTLVFNKQKTVAAVCEGEIYNSKESTISLGV